MKGSIIPVRASVAITATAVGLVLLLSFKTPDTTRPRNPVAVIPSPAPQASPAGADTGSASPSAPAAASPSPSASSGYKDGQYSGQDFQTEYGDTQVRVTISNGRITDVQAVQLPFDRQRSQEISDYVRQPLHDEALQAQSAQIDTISGATFTSDAYAQSLQSALDRARA